MLCRGGRCTCFQHSPCSAKSFRSSGPSRRGNSPLVANITLVYTPTTSVCGPPTILSVPPATVTTGICLEQQVIRSACMEALMQHYQAAGFSKEVPRLTTAPRRPSTNKLYDDRWLRFAHWATPLVPTAAQKAALLYDRFDTQGLSP